MLEKYLLAPSKTSNSECPRIPSSVNDTTDLEECSGTKVKD
jgi:hypothetical protein